MSQSNPNPDEQKRIVDAAVRHAMRSAPDLAAKPQDDIERLFSRFMTQCINARDRVRAEIDAGIQSNTIHSAQGRQKVLLKLHEEMLSALKDFDREELLFLLAWQQANFVMQEYV